MATAIFLMIVLGLLIYGLERNHARQLHLPGHLAGSSDVQDRDRDAQRVAAELRVMQ
jgi:hypothetical protein